MLIRLVVNWLILAIGLGVAGAVVPAVEVKGGFLTLMWVALLFGLVNALLGPILHFLSLPLTVVTLGLFAIVVNGVLRANTAGLSDNLDVGGFGGAVLGALVISIVTTALQLGLNLAVGSAATPRHP